MEAIIRSTTEITLTTTPTLEQMKIWWAELQHDPARRLAYTDFMPTELETFLEAMRRGDITVWMFLVGGDVAPRVGGVFYVHDTGADADGPYAWIGTYVLPPYRRLTLRAAAMVRRACERQGLRRFFVATRQSNRPVQMLLRHAGFTRLGIYPDWSYFNGTLDAVVLYTLRPEDRELAWALAEKRAQQFQCLVQAQDS
jgi:RimJ/RimL family protein N-acetyltransferase